MAAAAALAQARVTPIAASRQAGGPAACPAYGVVGSSAASSPAASPAGPSPRVNQQARPCQPQQSQQLTEVNPAAPRPRGPAAGQSRVRRGAVPAACRRLSRAGQPAPAPGPMRRPPQACHHVSHAQPASTAPPQSRARLSLARAPSWRWPGQSTARYWNRHTGLAHPAAAQSPARSGRATPRRAQPQRQAQASQRRTRPRSAGRLRAAAPAPAPEQRGQPGAAGRQCRAAGHAPIGIHAATNGAQTARRSRAASRAARPRAGGCWPQPNRPWPRPRPSAPERCMP